MRKEPSAMNINTVTVTGIGKISASPDFVTISCTVSAKDKNYSALTETEAEKMSEIISALIKAGFEEKDIKTSDFNLSTEYENCPTSDNKWVRRFTGYSLTRDLKFEFDLDADRLNSVIAALTSCEKAAPMFNISFTVKEKDGLYDLLLEKAVRDAAHKAGVIAAAAGMKLGSVQNISYGSGESPFMSPTLFRGEADGAGPLRCAAKMNIVPEDIVSETNVTVVYQLS